MKATTNCCETGEQGDEYGSVAPPKLHESLANMKKAIKII